MRNGDAIEVSAALARIEDLRRYAIARSLFTPVALDEAIARLGFVQADPIRAPARAQDLALRHRVPDYRAGDLDRAYPSLDVEEDVFINYGFVPRSQHALMHPRRIRPPWPAARQRRARAVLEFVRERGEVHPRDVEARFAHGSVTNAWGGSSSATTHLLDAMHYRGMLRVARREAGIRIYAASTARSRSSVAPGARSPSSSSPAARLDALVDALVRKYAPLTATGLASTVRRLRYGAPQLASGLGDAIVRAHRRLAHARIDGADWYWPADEEPLRLAETLDARVRLLAPFDPVVWDRIRFERFFGWPYRFEAYTPPARRKLGYYALLLLHVDNVIGWATVTNGGGRIDVVRGYVKGVAPRSRSFTAALDDELSAMRLFLTPRTFS